MKNHYVHNVSLVTTNGARCVIPIASFPDMYGAEKNAKEMRQALSELLKDAVLAVPAPNGDAQMVMTLQEFLATFLRCQGLQCVISEVDYRDGSPDILLPTPSGIIVPH